MTLPRALADLIEDYLFPSFTTSLFKVEKIVLPALASHAAQKGYQMGMQEDVQELVELADQLTERKRTQEDIDLIIGITMGIATAGHNIGLYAQFGEYATY